MAGCGGFFSLNTTFLLQPAENPNEAPVDVENTGVTNDDQVTAEVAVPTSLSVHHQRRFLSGVHESLGRAQLCCAQRGFFLNVRTEPHLLVLKLFLAPVFARSADQFGVVVWQRVCENARYGSRRQPGRRSGRGTRRNVTR